MLEDDQLPFPAYDRGHPNTAYNRERFVLQHEPRDFICTPGYDAAYGSGTWFARRIEPVSTSRTVPEETCVVVHGMARQPFLTFL